MNHTEADMSRSDAAAAFGAPGIEPRWTASTKEGIGTAYHTSGLSDPHSSVVLIQTRLEILDETLRDKLRLYPLLAPHLKGMGQNNSGWHCDMAGRKLFHVERENINLAFVCTPDFLRRSVGYVGYSDGWQDLMADFRMDWEFDKAENGNIALTAEIRRPDALVRSCGHRTAKSATHMRTSALVKHI